MKGAIYDPSMEVNCPNLLSIAVINTFTKNNIQGGGMGLFHFTAYSLSWKGLREGTQGRNLEARSKADAMEICCLLVYPGHFFIQPRIASLGIAPPTVGALPNQH